MIIRALFLINILFVANSYSMHTPPRAPKELVVPGAPVRAPHAANEHMFPANLAMPLNFNAVHAPLVPPAHPIWAPLAEHVANAINQLNLDNDASMSE